MIPNRSKNMSFLWNTLMSLIVFLPAFLLVAMVEAALHGIRSEGSITYHLDVAMLLYISYGLPVVGGSLVYSLALVAVPSSWPAGRQQLAAVLLSPLLPATIMVIAKVAGGITFFPEHPIATTVATLLYGLSSKTTKPFAWKKKMAWIGMIVFLFVGGYFLSLMFSIIPLTPGSKYSPEHIIQSLPILAVSILLCLVAIVGLSTILYRSYNQQQGK